MRIIAREWRKPKLVIAFFLLEFAFTIPALVLYALADPDEYRTKLWTDGAENGFNSSPKTALYDAANYRPVHIPLVWQPFITHYNIVTSVLITFLLLVKAIMFILHLWVPILSFIVHAACCAMFAYSVHVQSMPDMSDPAHPQPGAPWYIAKSCSVAHDKANIGYCQQAKAAFAVTVILVIIFGINALWAAFCSYPTAHEREQARLLAEEDEEVDILEKWSPEAEDEVYEMRQWPQTPAMPNSPWLNASALGNRMSFGSGNKGGASSDVKEFGSLASAVAEFPKTKKGPNTLPVGGPVPTPRTFAFRQLEGEA